MYICALMCEVTRSHSHSFYSIHFRIKSKLPNFKWKREVLYDALIDVKSKTMHVISILAGDGYYHNLFFSYNEFP